MSYSFLSSPLLPGYGSLHKLTSTYLALKADGTVWAWGANNYDQLGVTTTGASCGIPCSLTPVQVGGLDGVTAIAANRYTSIVLRPDGSSPSASQTLGPGGGTVTTDPTGGGATASSPLQTAVTIPGAGTVSIVEAAITAVAPTGYSFIGQQADISITDPATGAALTASPSNPFKLVFTVDVSQIPAGETASTLQIFRDGAPIDPCTASPAPCVSDRQTLAGGDAQLTILTDHASHWTVGRVQYAQAYQGIRQPINADGSSRFKLGSTIPVKFQLLLGTRSIANAVV